MKIIDKTSKEEQSFDSLQAGDVFKYEDNKIYMKIYDKYDYFNTFDFARNRMETFSTDMKVKKVKSELILHDAGWEG